MQYGLIGEHLGHSYSMEIHESIADYKYELKELTPAELPDFITKKEFKGINVTIPYKQDVIPFLDEISEQAKAIGAVNTIVNKDGKLYGYNTDFMGMKALIEKLGLDLNGAKVLILGTGGTSKTAKAVAESLGAKEIIKVSRSAKDGAITYEDAEKLHADAEIIINTTPVGMFPKADAVPIDLTKYPKVKGVVDAIYNPLRTNLVLEAKKQGAAAEGGLYMLAAQAVYASAYFQGIEVNEALTDKAFNLVNSKKQNLVLIGMPSCGKTTIGTELANRLGRKLVDTDALIIERIKMPISDYFAQYGEPAFRKVESEVIVDLAKESGLIVSTGGGAVLNPENVKNLKKNGICIFLNRSLDKLITTDDRPLSSDKEKLTKMFEVRYPIYIAAADINLPGDGTVEEVTAALLKEI